MFECMNRVIRRPHRRGVVLLFVAACIVILLGMVAFAVDVAYIQLTRTKLRVAVDSATRAAGETLSRTHDLDAARRAAKDIAMQNLVAGDPLLLEDSDIQVGHVQLSARGEWTFYTDQLPYNGIRVLGRRTTDSPSGEVPLFFGRFLGRDMFQPQRQSTVVYLDRDICLVVDRSSSMKLTLDSSSQTMGFGDPRFCQPPHPTDSRWAALVSAVEAFIDALETTPQEEHLGLVSYASDYTNCDVTNNASDINQYLSGVFADARAALDAITNTSFNGMTNISAGIDDGITVLSDEATARTFAGRTMVLFTDGHRTDGRDPLLAAEDAALLGITIHTVTMGNGANQQNMRDVALATGGNHYHAPDAATLVNIFREIAFSLPVIMTD